MEKQVTNTNDDTMALRDQPYLPLFVQDFLTDEKLNECSAQATGVYIKIMCLMHKSEDYGTILLKQKDKQNANQINNFALKLAKLLPFNFEVIYGSLHELLEEKVLHVEGDILKQKRMIEDGDISLKRSQSGKEGGKATQKNILFAKAKEQAKDEANSEYESDNDNEIVLNTINVHFGDFWELYDKKVGEKGKLQKKWENLKPGEREKAMLYIPSYKIAQPDKKFRKDPSTFINNKSWNDELIYSKNHNNGTAYRGNTQQDTPIPGIVTRSDSRKF